MQKLLPCQKDMLLTPEYDSNYQTIDYICRPQNATHHIVPLYCDDVETLEDILVMNEKVLNSFIQQVCENCPCSRIQGK